MIQKNINRTYSSKENELVNDIIVSSYDRFLMLERRNLIIASTCSIFSYITKLNPESGSFFGLTFRNLSEETYYFLLLLLNLYFIFAFLIYLTPSVSKSITQRKKLIDSSMRIQYKTSLLDFSHLKIMLNIKFYSWLFIHYILPIAMGLIALIIDSIKVI